MPAAARLIWINAASIKQPHSSHPMLSKGEVREAEDLRMEAIPLLVFIVDDDEAVRDSLKLLIETHGFTVKDYDSTAAFVRDYTPGQHQCLILDQHLPGSTGLDFLASPEGKSLDLPVILITGRGSRELQRRAAELGVSVYLQKPVAETALMNAIAQAAGGTASEK